MNKIILTKELFIETIDCLEKQYDHDRKCSEAFSVILPNDHISMYDNHLVNNQLVKFLQLFLNDNHQDSWIEYFLYELDFGRKYFDECVKDFIGVQIDISNSSKLYDYLLLLINHPS